MVMENGAAEVVLVVAQDGKVDICLDVDKVCHSRFFLPKMTNLAYISLFPELDLLDSAWQSNRLDHFYRWDCSNTGSLVILAI